MFCRYNLRYKFQWIRQGNYLPKINKLLSASDVKRLKAGTYFVGGVGGLTLLIGKPAQEMLRPSASWVLRIYVAGKRRNLGLGPYPEVSLAEARSKAKCLKLKVSAGIDPRIEKIAHRSTIRNSQATAKTFKDCAETYIYLHNSDYKNAKHAKQWRSTIETYAYPVIGNLLVSEITLNDILEILRPIWITKTETAKRLQGRIEKVFNYAITSGYRSKDNPARWQGYLSVQLPAPGGIKQVVHHASLPYKMLGVFMQELQKRSGMAARALEFLILTGVRSGSVRRAKWDEIDFIAREWKIPSDHTKTRQGEHRVPLTDQMVTLLKSLKNTVGVAYIFPSPSGSMLSDMALTQVMRKMRASGALPVDAVPHGFRSTFKVWAVEQTIYPSELSEIVLMHSVGNSVYEAYQRSDLFEKRRDIMSDWNKYVYLQQSHLNIELIKKCV
jgi:integrase